MDKWIRLDAETACSTETSIYLFGRSVNMLYRIDKKTGVIEILGSIPQKEKWSMLLVGKILYWCDFLILLPLKENYIWLFNLETYKWEKIELMNSQSYSMKFYQGFIYQNVLHMIGCEYPAIVRINLMTFEIEYDSRIYDVIRKRTPYDIYFRTEYIQNNNEIIMGCCCTNQICYYNMDDFSFKLLRLGDEGEDYEGIAQIEGEMQLFGRSARLLYRCGKAIEKNSSVMINNCHYIATVRYKGRYVLLSNISGESLVQNAFNDYEAFIDTCNFCEKKDEDNYIYLNDKGILKEVTDGNIKEYRCAIGKNKFYDFVGEKQTLLHETSSYNLSFLIDDLVD